MVAGRLRLSFLSMRKKMRAEPRRAGNLAPAPVRRRFTARFEPI
jgi:hypothetical protein